MLFFSTRRNVDTMNNQVTITASKSWFSKYYFPLKETRAAWRTADPNLGKEKYKLSLEDFVIAESKEAFKDCQPEEAPTG